MYFLARGHKSSFKTTCLVKGKEWFAIEVSVILRVASEYHQTNKQVVAAAKKPGHSEKKSALNLNRVLKFLKMINQS